MNILNLLKSAFPKPQIPQKRYLIMLVTILYVVLKVYVDQTQSQLDNETLDRAHEIAMQILADLNTDPDSGPYGEMS